MTKSKIILLLFLLLTINFIAQFEQLGNYQNVTSLSLINPAFSGEQKSVSIIYNKNIFGDAQLYSVNYSSFFKQFKYFSF